MLGIIIGFLFYFPVEGLENCHRYQFNLIEAIEGLLNRECDDIEEEDLRTIELLDLNDLGLEDFNRREINDIFRFLTKVERINFSKNALFSPDLDMFEEMNDLEFIDWSHNPLSNSFIREWQWFVEEETDKFGDLRDLEQVNFSHTSVRVTKDNQRSPSILIDPSRDVYETGTGTQWFDCLLVPCWKNHAYLKVNNKTYIWPVCEGDDPGDECDLIAKSWAEKLEKGNRLLVRFRTAIINTVMFDGAVEFYNEITFVRALRGKAQGGEQVSSTAIINAAIDDPDSVPSCLITDGFPLSNYYFCRYNSGIEYCRSDDKGLDFCRRYLLRNLSKSILWSRDNEYCDGQSSSPCPANWNQKWHRSGGSPKPSVLVFDPI